MVYSGDSDAVVPTRSSRSWVESLGLRPAGEHRPWLDAATNEARGDGAGLPRAWGRALASSLQAVRVCLPANAVPHCRLRALPACTHQPPTLAVG